MAGAQPDDVGTAVAHVWTRMLDVPRIAPADNFFALGGRSLEAATMLAVLQTELGISVSLADFFDLGTFADLLEHIAAQPHVPNAPFNARDLVVPLRRAGSDRPPLVLIHPHGGSALSYTRFAELLPPTWPVHGIMARGVETAEPPATSLDEMAELYVAVLEGTDMPADLAIGGWSFGAFVAYEVAVRLHRLGRTPRALLLIDPRPADPDDHHRFRHRPLWEQIRQTWHIDIDDRELAHLPDAERLQTLARAGRDQGRLPAEMTTEMLTRRAAVRDQNTRAFLRHTCEPAYPGLTHVFRTTDEGQQPVRAIHAYWDRLLTGDVHHHDVPGTHGRLLKEPAVTPLAALVAALEPV